MGCHFLPGDLLDPGIQPSSPTSPALADGFFTTVPTKEPSYVIRTSLVAQTVKRLSIMQETWVRFLGWEDPLEKEMATHSSILAWKIPWTEEPGGLQYMGSRRLGHN